MKPINKAILFSGLCLLMFPHAQAESLSEIQQRMNQQTLSQPFGVEDPDNLEAELQAAKKQGIPPVATPSKYWRRGYTCNDLRAYSISDYRNCRYYHYYYGRYWPY